MSSSFSGSVPSLVHFFLSLLIKLRDVELVATGRHGDRFVDVDRRLALHLLGFDHTQVTYRHAGRDFRLTDVFGEVIKPILA